MGYCSTNMDFPVCNHTEWIGPENLGYTRGITDTGVPFEAEMVSDQEDSLMLSVIMPAIFKDVEVVKEQSMNTNLIPFTNSADAWDDSILDYGMVDNGIEEDDVLVHAYVEYLEASGIITFASNILNGTVMNRVDILGNDLVKIIITMTEGDDYWAYTDLAIKPFNDEKSCVGKVISFCDRKS